MKNGKVTNIMIVLLLFISFNFLMLGVICYAMEDNIENYKYSDTAEYASITSGLSLINDLPIEFSIQNQYFSGFDSLSNEIRESILMAYFLKNNIHTYKCGDGNSICIDKKILEDKSIMKVFNSATEFTSASIKLYIDDYGKHSIKSTNTSPYYRIVLGDNNHHYRKYTRFVKYKEENDLYIFYVYEGYYPGNCARGNKISLYDFMTGEEVYTDKCNDKNNFEHEPGDEIKNLQLYKYELKKDEDGAFYLYGYNPVNK